jgi:hypothetical protein
MKFFDNLGTWQNGSKYVPLAEQMLEDGYFNRHASRVGKPAASVKRLYLSRRG